MRNNFIYVSTDIVRRMVVARGIDSIDFVRGLKEIPHNIILLNDDRRHANGLNAHTKFSVIQGQQNVKAYLLNDQINNKRVIDYHSNEDLDELLDYEIAELLYLSHMGFPMHDAFSSKLHNHYIYLMMRSHFTKIYYERLLTFNRVLNNSVKRHMLLTAKNFHSHLHFMPLGKLNRFSFHVADVPLAILKQLVNITENGMIIAFDETDKVKHHRIFKIPLLVEKFPDAQSTWYYKSDIYQNTKKIGWLLYNEPEKKWQFHVKNYKMH
ncbi:hypothetical protein [Acetilactobacillus jinshanensis]|uniref:Uncharacterized protein n=1 Tax=Acetilactobacillus jinshanensis TaxID=1720083 RepID=A0A4P6ZM62_9LACO|nr:hypothetical protein [Acetilactobacillus jinshanensis]QBP18874.1 hypothetical protein ELX58_07195 [Acetilactobacillus jinshanensis]URL60576.1 hypothetical protein HGK75_00600 [uncultured bacterium]